MQTIAITLGALVALSLLGCLGAPSETDPEPIGDEESIGMGAQAVTGVPPLRHGRGEESIGTSAQQMTGTPPLPHGRGVRLGRPLAAARLPVPCVPGRAEPCTGEPSR